MAELIPYFAGLITIIFGIGFYFSLQDKNNILSDYILGYLVRQFEADGFNLDNYDFIYQSLSMSHQDSLSLN